MKSLTLDNGLRVVYAPSPTNTVYLGLALDSEDNGRNWV